MAMAARMSAAASVKLSFARCACARRYSAFTLEGSLISACVQLSITSSYCRVRSLDCARFNKHSNRNVSKAAVSSGVSGKAYS